MLNTSLLPPALNGLRERDRPKIRAVAGTACEDHSVAARIQRRPFVRKPLLHITRQLRLPHRFHDAGLYRWTGVQRRHPPGDRKWVAVPAPTVEDRYAAAGQQSADRLAGDRAGDPPRQMALKSNDRGILFRARRTPGLFPPTLNRQHPCLRRKHNAAQPV